MTIDDLTRQAGEWLSGEGPECEVVMSSRIRLARNIVGYPFLSKASETQRREILRLVRNAIADTSWGDRCSFFDMDNTGELDRQVLVERHLISQQHAGDTGCRGVAVSSQETISLMIHEEDHLRMQVLRSGLQLNEAWDEINRLDSEIEKHLDFAYHQQYGYLTACPTNVGTGIRVSVMLHLPAVNLTDQLSKVLRATKDMRIAVRGFFGEGTDALGDFYQISNQTTLGRSEEEIIREFEQTAIPGIVDYERRARQQLIAERTALLDDKVWRAYGVLENARAVSTEETLSLLSHLRMGVHMGRLANQNLNLHTINELFLQMQPAHLQKLNGTTMDSDQRRVTRADYIRKRLYTN